MCGRFTLTKRELGEITAQLDAVVDARDAARYRPRYNVAPTDVHWIVERQGDTRRLLPATWGFVNDDGQLVINARAETVAEKRRFQEALARRRCVVPADGFFEWTGEKRSRRPVWFHAPDDGLLLFAALWETGRDGRPVFTLLTTEANELVAPVHDRMPVLLSKEGAAAWLAAPRRDLLQPAPPGALVARPVSERANAVEHDDPECLAPAPPEPPPKQLKLL